MGACLFLYCPLLKPERDIVSFIFYESIINLAIWYVYKIINYV
jgi:hypothetical protein